MSWLILGVSLLAAVLILGRWLLTADPKNIALAVRIFAAVVLGFLAAYLVVMGRWAFAIPAALGALTMLGLRRRGRPMPFGMGGMGRSASAGQSSEIRTEHLSMTLDHDSGSMEGIILKGAFEGMTLAELQQNQLFDLYRTWSTEDADSAALLESYFERRFGEEWRDGGPETGEPRETPSSVMTRSEALDILGLDEKASKADIKAAHRRLIAKTHPDQGGSTYLAAKINQAKDYLLGS